MEMIIALAGGLLFLVGLLFVIARWRSRVPLKRVAPDLTVSRSWLAEHQARHVGE
jgi:hypothetical protein